MISEGIKVRIYLQIIKYKFAYICLTFKKRNLATTPNAKFVEVGVIQRIVDITVSALINLMFGCTLIDEDIKKEGR